MRKKDGKSKVREPIPDHSPYIDVDPDVSVTYRIDDNVAQYFLIIRMPVPTEGKAVEERFPSYPGW
jgi:hypothetical protein